MKFKMRATQSIGYQVSGACICATINSFLLSTFIHGKISSHEKGEHHVSKIPAGKRPQGGKLRPRSAYPVSLRNSTLILKLSWGLNLRLQNFEYVGPGGYLKVQGVAFSGIQRSQMGLVDVVM